MRNLKLVFTTVFTGFLLSVFAGTPKVTISKSGCGKNGCYDVIETHAGDVHSLRCSGRGFTKCEFQYLPGFFNSSIVSTLIEQAEININNGIFSGTLSIDNYTIIWNHDNSNDSSTIEIFFNE